MGPDVNGLERFEKLPENFLVKTGSGRMNAFNSCASATERRSAAWAKALQAGGPTTRFAQALESGTIRRTSELV